jgi:hypothetical protein
MSDEYDIEQPDEDKEPDVEYEDYVSEGDSDPYESSDFRITVYGGKRKDVKDSIDTHLGSDTNFYQTWITLSMLKRLGFVFEGGVESSITLEGVICMFISVIAIFSLFFFWQFIIFFIVIAVLALFSGGAALRYMRGTFIESQTKDMDLSKVETFALAQIEAGRFIKVESDVKETEIGPIARKSTSVTNMFELGIWLSLAIATLFLIFQVVHWLVNGHWISGLNVDTALQEIYFLIAFGLAFLLGIIIMDIAVLKRGQLETELSGGYSSLSPPSA